MYVHCYLRQCHKKVSKITKEGLNKIREEAGVFSHVYQLVRAKREANLFRLCRMQRVLIRNDTVTVLKAIAPLHI